MTWARAYRKAKIQVSARASMSLDKSPSDLLIPAALWGYACSLRRDRGGEWRDVVAYLLDRHRGRILAEADRVARTRFQYQTQGQDLRRLCYVPYSVAHVHLRMLSFAARLSMCALFVQMLIWELEGDPPPPELMGFAGVPIEFESAWHWNTDLLVITAHLQMPSLRDGPPR